MTDEMKAAIESVIEEMEAMTQEEFILSIEEVEYLDSTIGLHYAMNPWLAGYNPDFEKIEF